MSLFEDFVNLELPRRPVMLTYEITAYGGNPNDVGAPAIIKGAPKGSFYLRNSDNALWRKELPAATSWSEVTGGGGGGSQIFTTVEALTFSVDYNDPTAIDPTPGLIFTLQSEINNFLTAGGATAFKHLTPVLDAIPYHVAHQVNVVLAAGVHRPRPTDTTAAFTFPLKNIFALNYPTLNIMGAPPSQWTVRDPSLVTLTISSVSAPNSQDPWIDVSGTPFATFDLRGYYAVLNTGQTVLIHKHTNSRLYVLTDALPTPATITKIASPSTILRNSLDDINQLAGTYANSYQEVFSGPLIFLDLKFEPFSAGNFALYGGSTTAQRVMYDSKTIPGYNQWIVWAYAFLNLQDYSALVGTWSACTVFAGGVSSIGIQNSYFQGSRWGVDIGGASTLYLMGGVVFDNAGYDINYGAAITIEQLSYFLAYGDIYYSSKQNEIRNQPAGVPGLTFRSGAYNREDYVIGIIFANNAGPCVRLFDGVRMLQQGIYGAVGLVDGGGNLDVGFDLRGSNASLRLDSRSTATGTLGDVRMADGDIWSYSDIKALGPVGDPSNDIVAVK